MGRSSWIVVMAALAGGRAGAQVMTPNEDLASLLPGTSVELDHAVIRAKSGNLARVRYHHRDIFVAPIDPSWLEFLTVGAAVDIHGTLREAPNAKQAQLVYAVGPRTAARLARDRIYIDAWAMTPS